MNEKTSQNQKEYHQKDKHLSCPLYKILGTILEMEARRTQKNKPEDKKTNDNAKGFTSAR